MPRNARARMSPARAARSLGPECLEGRQLLSTAWPQGRTLADPPAWVEAATRHEAAHHGLAHHGGHAHQTHSAGVFAAHTHRNTRLGHTPALPQSAHPLYRALSVSPPTAAPARTDLGTAASTVTVAPASSPGPAAPAPYTPAQIRHAYGFDQLTQTGAGQTIAIIDAYDDPKIASDLSVFDQHFGLPAANLIKATPEGTPAFDAGWSGEIALDVEWAHAIAPGATILLVEAKSSSLTDLLGAVDYAVAHGAKQVSMSFGGTDFAGESTYDSHFHHPGFSFFASAGDSGAGAEYPAASPFVTAVGGTKVSLDSAGNRISETAWSGSGGAATGNEAKPSYQNGIYTGTGRGIPDVSYNADPSSGVYVYNTASGGSWYEVGGTSAGAPQWAALAALVNQGRASAGKASLGAAAGYGTNQVLYAMAGGSSYTNARGDFIDVTSGSNGNPAKVGYDLVTGLGSPVANRLVPDLINS